jgi:hypothetical protein
VLSWLSRLFWRYRELLGECGLYAEASELPADDRGDRCDGRALDPGAVYIAGGIEDLERFVQLRSRRP